VQRQKSGTNIGSRPHHWRFEHERHKLLAERQTQALKGEAKVMDEVMTFTQLKETQ